MSSGTRLKGRSIRIYSDWGSPESMLHLKQEATTSAFKYGLSFVVQSKQEPFTGLSAVKKSDYIKL